MLLLILGAIIALQKTKSSIKSIILVSIMAKTAIKKIDIRINTHVRKITVLIFTLFVDLEEAGGCKSVFDSSRLFDTNPARFCSYTLCDDRDTSSVKNLSWFSFWLWASSVVKRIISNQRSSSGNC